MVNPEAKLKLEEQQVAQMEGCNGRRIRKFIQSMHLELVTCPETVTLSVANESTA